MRASISHPFIQRHTGVFRGALVNGNRMCIFGIMAAELDELTA